MHSGIVDVLIIFTVCFFCWMLWQVISELDGKDINNVISDGMGKLASMPSGEHQSSYMHVTLLYFLFGLAV